MIFFDNRKPRGFQHKFIYYDERKELLQDIERRSKSVQSESAREPDMPQASMRFVGSASSSKTDGYGIYSNQLTVFVVLLLMFIAFVMFYLY